MKSTLSYLSNLKDITRMKKKIIISLICCSVILIGCGEDNVEEEVVKDSPEEITKENLQDIQKAVQEEIRTTIATAKTRFIKEHNRVSQTTALKARRKIRETI